MTNITTEELNDLKRLLFGDSDRTFSSAWSKQGLNFKCFPPYGLMQNRPGPCGVIAAIQATVILEMVFGRYRNLLKTGYLRPNYSQRRRALSSAISKILFQARSGDNAVLVKLRDAESLDLTKEDELKLELFSSQDELFQEVSNSLKMFMNDGGIVLFLYSLILTRGFEAIKNDMDFPADISFIGADSYSAQELVNLIIVGQAVQNVFDGSKELEGGLVLKGIPRKSEVGFLSLSDYQDNDQVGEFYKSPEFPIWILNADLHYYVLFGTSRDVLETGEQFNLFYTDSLSRGGEILLTIDPRIPQRRSVKSTIGCIHTKWPCASVKVEEIKREEVDVKKTK